MADDGCTARYESCDVGIHLRFPMHSWKDHGIGILMEVLSCGNLVEAPI